MALRDLVQDYLVKEFGGGPADRETIVARFVEPEAPGQAGAISLRRGVVAGRYGGASALMLAAAACLIGLFLVGTKVIPLPFALGHPGSGSSAPTAGPGASSAAPNSNGSGASNVLAGASKTRGAGNAVLLSANFPAAASTTNPSGTSGSGGPGGGGSPGNVVSRLVLNLGVTLNTAITGLTTTVADTADGSTNLGGTVNGVTGTLGSTVSSGLSGIGNVLQV